MSYEIITLDLDGTLTNSEKKITPPTKNALIEIQKAGKQVILASGRPTTGVLPLAKELELDRFGGYVLSFNGGRIMNCKTGEIIYQKVLPADVLLPITEASRSYPVDILTYDMEHIYCIQAEETPNEYTMLESRINSIPVVPVNDFSGISFPVNKILISGEPEYTEELETLLKKQFRSRLNIYRSEPFFLEIMPANIDKAYSLQKLLNNIGRSANEMICCGDGFNDLTMLEFAGLGVAMANAQPILLERADFITKSNDEDGILHVIDHFMR